MTLISSVLIVFIAYVMLDKHFFINLFTGKILKFYHLRGWGGCRGGQNENK